MNNQARKFKVVPASTSDEVKKFSSKAQAVQFWMACKDSDYVRSRIFVWTHLGGHEVCGGEFPESERTYSVRPGHWLDITP